MVEENSYLDNLGLPDGLDQLDAAFVWGKNKKTYFFRYLISLLISGSRSFDWHRRKNLYWRYDDVKRQMDPGYPHDLSRWRGVPSDIDAAMQWTDGNFFRNKTENCVTNKFLKGRTYFFKNDQFWRFDDTLVRTEMRYPLQASPYWLGCPE